jgi:hypothetical protein
MHVTYRLLVYSKNESMIYKNGRQKLLWWLLHFPPREGQRPLESCTTLQRPIPPGSRPMQSIGAQFVLSKLSACHILRQQPKWSHTAHAPPRDGLFTSVNHVRANVHVSGELIADKLPFDSWTRMLTGWGMHVWRSRAGKVAAISSYTAVWICKIVTDS